MPQLVAVFRFLSLPDPIGFPNTPAHVPYKWHKWHEWHNGTPLRVKIQIEQPGLCPGELIRLNPANPCRIEPTVAFDTDRQDGTDRAFNRIEPTVTVNGSGTDKRIKVFQYPQSDRTQTRRVFLVSRPPLDAATRCGLSVPFPSRPHRVSQYSSTCPLQMAQMARMAQRHTSAGQNTDRAAGTLPG